jgi:FkbM family methyltransferase
MNLKKIVKWTRRGLVSAWCDHRWRSRDCRVTWLGSPSGGAYADLSCLGKTSVVYSFGIACEISFDRAIIQRTGCHVHGFDPDPRSEAWLARPEVLVPPTFHFSRIAIDAVSGSRTFFMTDMERMMGGFQMESWSESIVAECLSLADIMKRFGHEWVDYVKLDVEGAEYEVLPSWVSAYERLPVGQLWIEFHPNGKSTTEQTSMNIVKSLGKIGMMPAYRNYFRQPNNYLLMNRTRAMPRAVAATRGSREG